MQPVSAVPPSPDGSGEPVMVPYDPIKGRRDEAVKPDGALDPAWYNLFESTGRHGVEVLQTWRKEAMRISRERGLAYRPIHVEAGETATHWSLDPIPWVFSQEGWKIIEAGLSQRIRLFDAILSDLLGPQTLLERRIMPAQVVFGHKGFIHSLHNLPPSDSTFGLGMAAVDIAHDTGGQLFALNNRFDCPFGLGLALENRTVVNKVLPNLFRRCQTRRIGHFFLDWFDYLIERSPKGRDRSRTVILDSTPANEDSEITFLANYCRVSRVNPGDLTVRDGKVRLKVLAGLAPVDVIWKYTAGRDLDPLEVRHSVPSGVPGVPGVFEAMRNGKVTVASHPACEMLQSSGFSPYLANICRQLLGEELLIPPVATWWCGKASARSHVLANLAKMVVKPAGHHHDFQTVYGSRLSKEKLAELKATIQANPGRFVGQEELRLSTIPTSTPQGLKPRGAVLRTFAFPRLGGIVNVMPGGLARVSTEDGTVVSTRFGGESKDVWVLSNEPAEPVSIAGDIPISPTIRPDTLPSRVAENLFWAGGYAERADLLSRFATRLLEGRVTGFSHDPEIEAEHESNLMRIPFEMSECLSWHDNLTDADERFRLLLNDPKCPVSINKVIRSFRNAAQAAREKWSPSSILAIESICDGWLEDAEDLGSLFSYGSFLQSLQLNLSAFLGLNLDSMTRDEGWAMLDAGRRLERISSIARLLRILVRRSREGQISVLLNESVLHISDSLRTYQNKYQSTPETASVLRLLLHEADYPRSVRFLLKRLQFLFQKLPDPALRKHPGKTLPLLSEQTERVLGAYDSEIPNWEEYAERELSVLIELVSKLYEHITTAYFSHAGFMKQPSNP